MYGFIETLSEAVECGFRFSFNKDGFAVKVTKDNEEVISLPYTGVSVSEVVDYVLGAIRAW